MEPYPSMHEEVIYDVVHPVSSALRTAASIALAKCPDIDSGYTLSKILGKKLVNGIFRHVKKLLIQARFRKINSDRKGIGQP